MAVFESIKDLLGILDDAQDIVDRVDKIMRDVEPITKKLKQDGEDLAQDLERAKKAQDAEEVDRILGRLDVRRPFLLGRTLLQKLEAALDDLIELRKKIADLDPALQAQGIHVVDSAIDEVKTALDDSHKVIKLISDIQKEHRDSRRKVLKIVGGAAVGAAVTTAAVGFILALSVRTVAFRALTSSLFSAGARTVSVIKESKRAVNSIRENVERQQ